MFTCAGYNRSMGKEILEIERKYDVVDGSVPPDLTGVVPGAVTGESHGQQLVATYLDTEDLRLRAARITLRHRTGGTDAGWHLKLPAGSARLEVHARGRAWPADPPAELLALVKAVVRRQPLTAVAELRTSRTVHPLLDDRSRILLELVDDTVEARRPDSEAITWREWEVEVVAGDPSLLDAVEPRIQAAGGSPSAAASKVARVLPAAPSPSRPPLDGKATTAGDVLVAHLREQVRELVQRDPDVRRDEDDAVHKMRVATRRLRSALSTFRPLLDRERTDPLRDELRWLAGSLGAARDAEVLHARIVALVAEQPADLVLGPVRTKVDELLLGRYRRAHDGVLEDLDSERYLSLLDALDALLADPPLTALAGKRATTVLPQLAARADRRLTHAVEAVARAEGTDQDPLLHEARKLAKRLRYACEAVAPAIGRPAARLASAAESVQEVLGEHQDSVVTRGVLRELGAGSTRSGQNGFTFGRLHALEQARAEQGQEQWRGVWGKASRRRLRRWLAG